MIKTKYFLKNMNIVGEVCGCFREFAHPHDIILLDKNDADYDTLKSCAYKCPNRFGKAITSSLIKKEIKENLKKYVDYNTPYLLVLFEGNNMVNSSERIYVPFNIDTFKRFDASIGKHTFENYTLSGIETFGFEHDKVKNLYHVSTKRNSNKTDYLEDMVLFMSDFFVNFPESDYIFDADTFEFIKLDEEVFDVIDTINPITFICDDYTYEYDVANGIVAV